VVNFLSSWVKNLSLAIIVVSILEMLLPNNKTKKYVKMVMGLYILFSIISPFIKNSDKLNFENIDVSSYINEELDTSNVEVNQESMDKRLKEIYIEELENDITKKLKEKGYTIEYCKVDANISQENNDSGIKKITLKLDKKEETRIDENSKANENTTETIENKIVSEIQKIQKVEVKVGNNTKENSAENENSKITKTDIESVKEFLISEYGVSKSCLKIN
jgi:stage III sporulation protein AF